MSKYQRKRNACCLPTPNGLSLAIISSLLIGVSGSGWARDAHDGVSIVSSVADRADQPGLAVLPNQAAGHSNVLQPSAAVMAVASDPASWRSDEFNRDWGLAQINADVAYSRGLTGSGIRLGVFDTGTGLDHDEFAGKDHHSLRIGDLLADGTRCSNTVFIAGPDACFASDGDVVSLDVVVYDPSVPENIRRVIENGPYVQVGANFQVHGTHVAGTIAANRDGVGTHGVAFGSDLTVAKHFFDTARKWTRTPMGYGLVSVGGSNAPEPSALQDMLKQMNADGVRALNHSWGLVSEPRDAAGLDGIYAAPAWNAYLDAYAQGSREKGMIQVWAAGNSDAANPSPGQAPIAGLYATLPRAFAEIEPYWLSVVNLDSSGELSDWSHRCGYSANWCVAAPGTLIESSIYGDDSALAATIVTDANGNVGLDISQRVPTYQQGLMSGTSMAAPHVTGALGLLMERFPYLDNAQVRDVLLTTATDLGAPGVDDVYGWGLINLAKGVEGFGSLRVDTDVVMNQAAGGAKVWQGDAWDDWTNDISGPGRLGKYGVGWLRLSGDNSFNGISLGQGTLELDGRNALSAAVDVYGGRLLLNGSLLATQVNQHAGHTWVTASGVMEASDIHLQGGMLQLDGQFGNGLIDAYNVQLSVADTGHLNASQLYLYDAAARLDGRFGSLQMQASSSQLGFGASSLLEASQLQVDGGYLAMDGLVRNSELITRNTQVEVGRSAQLYATDIRIDSGTLAFNGLQQGGHTYVGVDALLKGAGQLADLTVAGIVAPGNSIGTLTIEGNYVQLASATYVAELAPGGRADQLNIRGSASLAGKLVALPEPGVYYLGEQFNFLQAAAGVSGAFSSADFSAFSPFLKFELGYQAGGARIDVVRGQSLASAAATPNQHAVAAAADVLAVDHGLPRPLTQLFPEQLGAALDGLSGELHAATPVLLTAANRHLRDALTTRLGQLDPSVADVSAAWVQVLSSADSVDGTAATARSALDGRTWLIGADHRLGLWSLGLMAGSGRSDIQQGGGRAASSKVQNLHAGLYAGRTWQAFSLHGALTFSEHDVRSRRQVGFAGYSDSLHGRQEMRSQQAFIEASYRYDNGLSPYLQLARVEVDGVAIHEQGGVAALHGEVDSMATAISTAGLRFQRQLQPWRVDGLGPVHVQAGLAWRQLHGDRQPTASLAWQGSAPFPITGAALDASGWLLELGAGLQLGSRQQLDLGYSGQGGGNSDSHSYHARWSIRF